MLCSKGTLRHFMVLVGTNRVSLTREDAEVVLTLYYQPKANH